MSEHSWKNIYNLSTDQLNDLDEAEDMIEKYFECVLSSMLG